jgi:hypothetical protein
LKRLPMAVSSLILHPFDFAVLEGEEDFRLADDLLIVGRKDEGGLELVAHLLHQVQERRLAAPGRPDKGDERRRFDLETDILEGLDCHLAHPVFLADLLRSN